MSQGIPFTAVLLLAISGFQLTLCEDPTTVPGIIGEATEFMCDLPQSNPPNIIWSDFVWNMDRNPARIYSNADGINADHQNADNYAVDPESFTLTLRKTDLNDAGQIFCESVINDTTTLKKIYELSTAEPPMCEGNADLTNGQNTKLTCKADYSGDIPTLQWKRGTEALEQMDEFDIQLAKVSVSLDATPDHDQEEIVCSMEHLGKMASCKIKLDVKYPVMDLKIEPLSNDVRVKQKITCSARGNPAPKITLNPGEKQGEGSASILVGKEWLGTVQEVACSASNTYQGKVQIDSVNSTYEVLEPEEPGPSTGGAGVPIGLVVGIIIGVVVILVIIIAVICVKRKQAAKKQGHKPIPQTDNGDMKA